ncbi:MAG: ribosome recycling factor [Chloroflexota bacterium]|nr:ribosome recycling factor [Chloroflexota bacterium]
MVRELLRDGEERMDKAVEALMMDLRAIRTGRANPALLERLTIDYYGVQTPVNQVAGISAPEPRMLMIKPWDQSAMKSIERAILESDLGLNPNTDGQVIRLVLPQLTRERRQELVRQVGKRTEEARVAIRNIRRDVLKDLEDAQKEGMMSEDELYRARDQVQELTDEHIKQVDEIAKDKEEEIMEF